MAQCGRAAKPDQEGIQSINSGDEQRGLPGVGRDTNEALRPRREVSSSAADRAQKRDPIVRARVEQLGALRLGHG